MNISVACVFALMTLAGGVVSELAIGSFTSGDLTGWHEESFRGKAKTSYKLVTQSGMKALQAYSHGAASGLLKKVDLDPKKYPVLRWSWKVEHSLKKEDVTKKSGDDFAARVYVVFPRALFWRTRAINYVWASRLPRNSDAPSPYAGNAFIVAVESGDDQAGGWIREERNVYQDYTRLFGEEPPRIGAVAIMTDTDDTGDEVTAWYGDITLANR